jgi:hypothetical protein
MATGTLERPTAFADPVVVDLPTPRRSSVEPSRSWSPYDAPVHRGSAATRKDRFAYAATLAVSQPAYIVASLVGACGLAIATPIVLAWEQRQGRRYRARPEG